MPRTKKGRPAKSTPAQVSKPTSFGPFERIQNDLQLNQSSFSLILGILIVVALGILIYNYFNKPQSSVGPSQETQATDQNGDVTKEALPGKYTVKDGDTLFLIAEKYYGDGSQFSEIMKANNLTDENLITTGQVLDIPKLAQASESPTPTPSESPSESPNESPTSGQASPSETPVPTDNTQTNSTQYTPGGVGGSTSQTEWGPTITSNTYTVVEGDWLSKIAGRAYGDIYQYQKIAQANNISNPDLIEPGMVLTIPR